MYKIEFRLVPKQFTELFTKIEDQRSSIECTIPRTRSKIAQKSFTYTGIGIWSSIDPTIQSIPNDHLYNINTKKSNHIIENLKNKYKITSKILPINYFVL